MNLSSLLSSQIKKNISNFLISFLSWHGRHGQGTFTWPDGSSYEGEWVNGKRHGQGTFTWPDGSSYKGVSVNDKRHGQGTFTSNGITVKCTYVNDICTDFSEVEIQKKHRFFRKDGVLHYQIIETESQPVSTKNKRLEDIFKQLGNNTQNIKPTNDIISCGNKEEFGQKIENLKKESSSTTENTPIIKAFIIPGHAFVMIFKKGEAYCYDNGAIQQDLLYETYKQELESRDVIYKKISILNKLVFLLENDSSIEIEMPQNSLVCRHLACIIYQKMQEFINKKVDPIEAFDKYCKEVADKERRLNLLVRCNSFEQIEETERRPNPLVRCNGF